MPNATKTQIKTHRIRTFFASIMGTIAVSLILVGITVVWLNRTLTDTGTYVNTVAPLVTKPAIQKFIAQKVAEQLLNNAPTQDLANTLLPTNQQTAAQSPDQLKTMLEPVIEANVLQVIQSPNFAQLWRDTNQTTHASLVSQLNSTNNNELTLDLTPAINGVIADLQTTELKSVAGNINPNPNSGKIDIKNSNIARLHQYYKLFQEGTVAIILAALLAAILAVWLSVHHGKTARRILFGVGIITLIQALILAAPSVVSLPGTDQVTQDAAKAVIQALVQNLLIASIAVGTFCVVVAVVSKLYSIFATNGQKAKPNA